MWNVLIVLLAIAFYCYRSQFFHSLDPISYSISLPEEFDGLLKVNDRLDQAEQLFENVMNWPEAFAVHNGDVYTGLGDGRIVRLMGDKIATICRIGKECGGQHEEHICGRPLGMQFSKDGLLYVVDAYLGLFVVNVKTGEKKNILPSSKTVEDLPLTFLNDLELDEKEGAIYLTQSSTKWNISMVLISILEHDTSGRLLKYNLKTKAVTVLLRHLSFPNGVEMSHDGSALLVAEGNNHKIFKYHLQKPKVGLKVDLPLVLPGEPDNLSRNKRGNYWVGIATARTKKSPALHDMVSEYPILRKIFLVSYKILITPVHAVLSLLPYKTAKEFGFELSYGRIIADLAVSHGIIVEFDDEGNIIQSLHSPSGKVARISEVLEHGGYLYLGSWRNRFLGRLKL